MKDVGMVIKVLSGAQKVMIIITSATSGLKEPHCSQQSQAVICRLCF